jgi:hypothetical protein
LAHCLMCGNSTHFHLKNNFNNPFFIKKKASQSKRLF